MGNANNHCNENTQEPAESAAERLNTRSRKAAAKGHHAGRPRREPWPPRAAPGAPGAHRKPPEATQACQSLPGRPRARAGHRAHRREPRGARDEGVRTDEQAEHRVRLSGCGAAGAVSSKLVEGNLD